MILNLAKTKKVSAKQLIASTFGWALGTVLFTALNFYLFLKKSKNDSFSQSADEKRDEVRKLDSSIAIGSLPGSVNGPKSYKIPHLPESAKRLFLEISISPHPKQLSEEFEFSVFSGRNNCVHVFLFLKPFENEPELNYASEKILIDIPENRKVEIRLEGRTGRRSDFAGEVRIIGYC